MCGILIVDDDASIRFAMVDYFGAKGHRADSVATGEAAQAHLREGHYGVVITDLRLTPSGDAEGLEIVRLVSERYRGTVCIVLTAYGSAESEATARRHGAGAFLHKPRPMAELLEIVEQFVSPGGTCPTHDRNLEPVAQSTPDQPPAPEESSMSYQISDEVVELIWHDLAEQVERPRVAQVAQEIATSFGDVKITAFAPVFVRRLAVDRLRPELGPRA